MAQQKIETKETGSWQTNNFIVLVRDDDRWHNPAGVPRLLEEAQLG